MPKDTPPFCFPRIIDLAFLNGVLSISPDHSFNLLPKQLRPRFLRVDDEASKALRSSSIPVEALAAFSVHLVPRSERASSLGDRGESGTRNPYLTYSTSRTRPQRRLAFVRAHTRVVGAARTRGTSEADLRALLAAYTLAPWLLSVVQTALGTKAEVLIPVNFRLGASTSCRTG